MLLGNGLNCAKILPESAAKFFVYENIKIMISNKTNKDLTMWQRFLAGSAAGAISQVGLFSFFIIILVSSAYVKQ